MKKTKLYTFLMGLVLIMWNMSVFKPVKVVAVFVHEVGHYLMSLLFSRKLAVFNMTLDEVSHSCKLADSWLSSFFIANGGYIMSLIFAVLILRMNKKGARGYILGLLSLAILISLVYIKDVSAVFVGTIIFLIITILLYMLDNDKIFECAIDIIGISSIAYCLYETLMRDILPHVVNKFGILKDIASYNRATTDSQMLCKLTGIPVFLCGIFWFFVSLIVMIFCMNMKRQRKY